MLKCIFFIIIQPVSPFVNTSGAESKTFLSWQNRFQSSLPSAIMIHRPSRWYFIFGHSPNRYWLCTSAFFYWPASHATVTYYPLMGPVGQICSIDRFLYLASIDSLCIPGLLLCFSPRCLRNIPYTKIRGFCMQTSYSPTSDRSAMSFSPSNIP